MLNFLTFSDSAKFADIARNLVLGLGYGGGFTFWSNSVFGDLKNIFSQPWVPPVMPYSIAAFFKIFGVSDFAVIATSFFYFLLTLVFVFLLTKKVFKSNLTAVLSTIAVGFNYDLINYAINGASEAPFIFEIVAATYFISLKKNWATIISLSLLILSYFTRPQAFIYIAGLIFYYLLQRFSFKKSILYFVGVSMLAFLVDRFLLTQLSGKYFIYSIFFRGMSGLTQNISGISTSDSLRGAAEITISLSSVFKKIFYNLYNFYKLMPQIMSPYLLAIFVFGIFVKSKDKNRFALKISTILMFTATVIAASASIPFFRYIHPIVPLIYIIAVATVVEFFNLTGSKRFFAITIPTLLILILGVGQTLGVIFLDSRFEKNNHNTDKPPLHVVLSKILRENTTPNQIVVTNLDTWGSWYGERKTIWFPLDPKQLLDPASGKIPFDAIYLTSYKIDDQNYYMSNNWRLVFNNPDNPKKWTCDGCGEIAKEFVLKDVYSITSADDYERRDSKAILLVRK